jgi:hypothetical protein
MAGVERLAPVWAAYHYETSTAGGRDLLGLGDLGDALAEILVPNLRATSWRARYFTLLTLAVHLIPPELETAEAQRHWVFDFERAWLLAVCGRYLKLAKWDETAATRRLAAGERGLLGRGRGRIVSPTLAKAAELLRGATDVRLARFVPLQAPQTSGMYGRYVGAARSSRLLAGARGLLLDTNGSTLAQAAFDSAQSKKQGKLQADFQVALATGRLVPWKNVHAALASLRLGGIHDPAAKDERRVLAGALLESNEQTRITAATLRRAAPRVATTVSAKSINAMIRALPPGEPAQKIRAVLEELPAFDEARRALERVLLALAAHTEAKLQDGAAFRFARTELARARGVKAALEAVPGALRDVKAGQHPALAPLREAIAAHTSGKRIDAVGLVAALHGRTMARRGVPAWFRADDDALHLERSLGPDAVSPELASDEAEVVADLGRYRLGALRSLVSDLAWKGAP